MPLSCTYVGRAPTWTLTHSRLTLLAGCPSPGVYSHPARFSLQATQDILSVAPRNIYAPLCTNGRFFSQMGKAGKCSFVFLLLSFQRYTRCRNPWHAAAHIFLIFFNSSGPMSFSRAKFASTGMYTLGFVPSYPYHSGCLSFHVSPNPLHLRQHCFGFRVGWCCVAH